MSEREPTLRDVLGAVNELRGEVSEVRIGLGDMRGRLERLDGKVAEQGERLDRVDNRLERFGGEVIRQGERLDRLGGEVETLKRDLPAQVVAGVLMGFERSAYVSDLRILQEEMAQVKADVAELKRASGK